MINDKSNLSKFKVSLVPEETSEKENFLHATQLHKRMVSMLLQTLLEQISMPIQKFISVKASIFWKRIQQFDYCNKTSKEINQRYSVFGSSHWEPDKYSVSFSQNLW